ncbi:hypothetical protein EBB79_02990 [Parasedimentitalea marina]|uniref:CopG family transcriptional regulator n=1 Tax=Parasedimentitalea marina TaxID=2483033 RepID=A0A3T0MYZ8_9RHOB|nr:hypothetical protein EBB79_02990 [Parasedimentitalea marina]
MPPKRTSKDAHRIHILMDDDELKEVDDYSFHPSVQIRTRSAAIRSLIEKGLAQHRSEIDKADDS